MVNLTAITQQVIYLAKLKYRSFVFGPDKQIILLENIHQLLCSDAYIAEIADHIVEFGSKFEQRIGASIVESINNNASFADGLKPYVDPMAYQAIIAGERSGNSAQGIINAIDVIKMRKSMAKDLIWALIKPLAGISLAFAASAAIANWVFPLIARNSDPVTWKPWAAAVYDFGLFWVHFGLPIAAIVTSLIVLGVITIPFLTGPLRTLLDNVPFYRQYRMMVLVNTLRSLGYMTRAGHDIADAMGGLINHSTEYLKSHLEVMLQRLGSEDNLGDIMDTGLLTKEWSGLLKMVGKSGHYDISLLRSAEVIKHKLDQDIFKLSNYGAAAIKIIGLGIFFFIIGGTLMLVIDLIKVRPF